MSFHTPLRPLGEGGIKKYKYTSFIKSSGEGGKNTRILAVVRKQLITSFIQNQ